MPNKKSTLPPPVDPKKEPITVAVLTGKLDGLFNNVKELVETTARRTENALGAKIEKLDHRLTQVEITVKGHSNAIMELSREMKEQRTQLTEHGKLLAEHGKQLAEHGGRLQRIETKLVEHDKRFDTIETKLVEHDKRFDEHDKRFDVLETKIDKIGERLDNHETRITAMETAHP